MSWTASKQSTNLTTKIKLKRKNKRRKKMCDGSITTMVSNQNRIRYCWIVYCTNSFYIFLWKFYSFCKVIGEIYRNLMKSNLLVFNSQPIVKVTRDCQQLNRNPMQLHRLRAVHKHSPQAIYLTQLIQRILPKTHQTYRRPKKTLKQAAMNNSNSNRKPQLVVTMMTMIWPLYI